MQMILEIRDRSLMDVGRTFTPRPQPPPRPCQKLSTVPLDDVERELKLVGAAQT